MVHPVRHNHNNIWNTRVNTDKTTTSSHRKGPANATGLRANRHFNTGQTQVNENTENPCCTSASMVAQRGDTYNRMFEKRREDGGRGREGGLTVYWVHPGVRDAHHPHSPAPIWVSHRIGRQRWVTTGQLDTYIMCKRRRGVWGWAVGQQEQTWPTVFGQCVPICFARSRCGWCVPRIRFTHSTWVCGTCGVPRGNQ